VLIGAGLFVLVAAYLVWQHLSPAESTDDAQVSGHVSPVAARIGGPVKAIHVADNQVVQAGTVLVEIDPRDYELALQRAEADLAAARASSRAARTGVPITNATSRSQLNAAHAGASNAEAATVAAGREADAAKAKLQSAQARLAETTALATRASQDLERLRPLMAKDEISKQQFDAAQAAADAARATAQSAAAGVSEAEANLAVAEAHRQQATGAVAQAQAQESAAATAPQQVALTEARAAGAEADVLRMESAVEQAKLNLERTVIRAATGGVVSRRAVEVGQVVQPGQPLMAITSLDDVWVTANFKETQLRRMKPGLSADVDVDAYGRTLHGHVDSIAAATGATFSLLPPDNASGNFVKVVQRVPVKIVLDKSGGGASPLRPGMSVSATVYLK
jgi:membrane fusion protein (multidrug efflux system)